MSMVISKPRPLPIPSPSCSGRISPLTTQVCSESPRSIKSSKSAGASQPSRIVAGGCGGPSTSAGPSACQPTCVLSPQHNSANLPPRPEDADAPKPQLYQAQSSQPDSPPAPPSASPSFKPTLRRLSTVTLHRHLSIASSSSVLPFSNKRRPSVPLEDFPKSPSDDEWEDFSFEKDIPVSPSRQVVRKKSSTPLSPRLTRGPSLSRSHVSRRSRKSRYTGSRAPTSPATNSNNSRPLSLYSTYSYYSPSQLGECEDPPEQVADSEDPVTSLMSFDAESLSDHEFICEFDEVPGGSNLEPRGSISSIATVRPSVEQRNQTRLGGLRDKLRSQWRPSRSGNDSSSDESFRMVPDSDSFLSSTAEAAFAATTKAPARSRCGSHAPSKQKQVVFNKPGFRSLSKSSMDSNEFNLGHGYRSSTDSSSYAPSFSSFEQNLRFGGKSGSYSSCGEDWPSEDSPRSKQRPLSPSRASSVLMPVKEARTRTCSDNYAHLRPRPAASIESIRQPTLRVKNGVLHHSCDPARVPYPLAYSANMMAADRWNHVLLFGDDRNPANAGGLLRGSTVSFSQFYGVGSGKKEILRGRELRGGKVLDLGCGEGLWVLAAAKEWRHTCFVGFDLLPVQMNLREKLDGVKNAQDIIDRIEWVQGDFLREKLPFADNSFDLVRLANTTLALPIDPEKDNCRLRTLFSEIFRILKVDGEFEIIDENHTVPSNSKASPANPRNKAFDSYAGPQMCQLEQAFEKMLRYHKLSAYPVIPTLLRQHFSTSSEKATFRLAVAPDSGVVKSLRQRGEIQETAVQAEIDRDLGLIEDHHLEPSGHGRTPSCSSSSSRNRKMLQLFGKEFAETRKPAVPQGLIVLPNKMLPMSPAAVYAHATHSTNVILAAKEQLFNYVELCARGKADVDRQEFEGLLWNYEISRFDRIGLRDPLQSFNDWDTGISDANDGLWSGELRSPRFASSPPPDASRVGSMSPLPAWRYESDSEVVAVREIRVCLARKLNKDPPSIPSTV